MTLLKKITFGLLFVAVSFIIIEAIIISPPYIAGNNIRNSNYKYVENKIKKDPDFVNKSVRYSENMFYIYITHLVGIPTQNYSTPILLALSDKKMLKLLLENGANPNGNFLYHEAPLYKTAYHNAVEATKILLKYGADPNLDIDIENPILFLSPLDIAQKRKSAAVEKILLEHGALSNMKIFFDKYE